MEKRVSRSKCRPTCLSVLTPCAEQRPTTRSSLPDKSWGRGQGRGHEKGKKREEEKERETYMTAKACAWPGRFFVFGRCFPANPVVGEAETSKSRRRGKEGDYGGGEKRGKVPRYWWYRFWHRKGLQDFTAPLGHVARRAPSNQRWGKRR